MVPGVFFWSLGRKTRDMLHVLEACAGCLDRSASRPAAQPLSESLALTDPSQTIPPLCPRQPFLGDDFFA